MLVKNTYGTSVLFHKRPFGFIPETEFTGSALQRKKQKKRPKKIDQKKKKKGEVRWRSLSKRSKQKIKKKIMCFSQDAKRMSFVTLTFLNKVSDEEAIKLLRKFIDNVKKRSSNKFHYIWVVERQTKNAEFIGNPHFHMITNKYWRIEKWWNYWINLQLKNGVTPRKKGYKPSSAFDVKQLNSKNIRSIASYVTKYITKNNDKFKCQVWNCSKGISELHTDFYTNEEFTDQLERVGGVKKTIEVVDKENDLFLDVKLIDLNRKTLPLYSRLREANHKILNN